MSFSDSNATNRFKGLGKVLKDLKSYTVSQGQQACNAIKGHELMTTMKHSTGNKFPSFKRNRVHIGNMKHQSLCEDDEEVLWRDYDESKKTKDWNSQLAKKQTQCDSLKGTEFSFMDENRKKNFARNDIFEQDYATSSKSNYNTTSGFEKGMKRIPFLRKVA